MAKLGSKYKPTFGNVTMDLLGTAGNWATMGIMSDKYAETMENPFLKKVNTAMPEIYQTAATVAGAALGVPQAGQLVGGIQQIGKTTQSAIDPEVQQFALGGNIQSYEGMPNHNQGGVNVDALGNPSAQSRAKGIAEVEGGEFSYDGYVFSNRLKPSKKAPTFAEEFKALTKKYGYDFKNKKFKRDSDPIVKNEFKEKALQLKGKQDNFKVSQGLAFLAEDGSIQDIPQMAKGGNIPPELLKEQSPYLVPEYNQPMVGNTILPDPNRPKVPGTQMSEYKMNVGFDGQDYSIPTVVGGQYLGAEGAVERFKATGERFKNTANPQSYSKFYDEVDKLGIMKKSYGGTLPKAYAGMNLEDPPLVALRQQPNDRIFSDVVANNLSTLPSIGTPNFSNDAFTRPNNYSAPLVRLKQDYNDPLLGNAPVDVRNMPNLEFNRVNENAPTRPNAYGMWNIPEVLTKYDTPVTAMTPKRGVINNNITPELKSTEVPELNILPGDGVTSPTTKSSIFSDLPTSAKVGMGIQGLTGLANAAYAFTRKPQTATPNLYTPEDISLANQREDIREQARLAERQNLDLARRTGSLSGFMNTARAGAAGINRNAGAALGESYMREEAANVGARNQALAYNAQERSRTDEINRLEKDAIDSLRMGAISNIGTMAGNMSRDILAYQSEAEKAGWMGSPNYQNFRIGGKNVRGVTTNMTSAQDGTAIYALDNGKYVTATGQPVDINDESLVIKPTTESNKETTTKPTEEIVTPISKNTGLQLNRNNNNRLFESMRTPGIFSGNTIQPNNTFGIDSQKSIEDINLELEKEINSMYIPTNSNQNNYQTRNIGSKNWMDEKITSITNSPNTLEMPYIYPLNTQTGKEASKNWVDNELMRINNYPPNTTGEVEMTPSNNNAEKLGTEPVLNRELGNISYAPNTIEENSNNKGDFKNKEANYKIGNREVILDDVNKRPVTVFQSDTTTTSNNNPFLDVSPANNNYDIRNSYSFEEMGEDSITPELLIRQAIAESAFRINATSSAGAQGIAQFMPSTARDFDYLFEDGFDPNNPEQAVIAQKTYMNSLLSEFQKKTDDPKEAIELALASYNWGRGNVNKAINKHGKDWKKHLPKETKTYLDRILYGKGLELLNVDEAYKRGQDAGILEYYYNN